MDTNDGEISATKSNDKKNLQIGDLLVESNSLDSNLRVSTN